LVAVYFTAENKENVIEKQNKTKKTPKKPKTTLRCHLTPVRIGIIKNTTTDRWW
jgi:hypothetical protein